MLRTLSLVELEIRSVLSYTAGFLWVNPLSRRTSRRGVEAFRQQRVREDRVGHVGGQRAPLAADLRISSQLGSSHTKGNGRDLPVCRRKQRCNRIPQTALWRYQESARYTTHFYARPIVRIFPVHSKGAGRALPLLLGGRERRLGAWNMADWLASPFALQPKPRRPRSQSS